MSGLHNAMHRFAQVSTSIMSSLSCIWKETESLSVLSLSGKGIVELQEHTCTTGMDSYKEKLYNDINF